jgi:hypothetical protein
MHLADGVLVLSASDLIGFLECGHLTGLDVATARGELEAPQLEDPELEVLRRRGGQHERAISSGPHLRQPITERSNAVHDLPRHFVA